MAFSESLGFGNSTLNNFEEIAKQAIIGSPNDLDKNTQMAALTEDMEKLSVPSMETCMHENIKTKDEIQHYNAHLEVTDYKTDFFESDFSFCNDTIQFCNEHPTLKFSSCSTMKVLKQTFPDTLLNSNKTNFFPTNEYHEWENNTLLDEATFIMPNQSGKSSKDLKKQMKQSRRELLKEAFLEPHFRSEQNLNLISINSVLQTTIKTPNHSLFKNSLTNSLKYFDPSIQLTTDLEKFKSLSYWNLPLAILREYEKKGLINMFDWQVECLRNPKVLFEHCNLVYSAPTSAGKTLISEVLILKTVLEREKKVMFILPFISVVREKMLYLQDLLKTLGYRVEGFYGGYTPPGGFENINVAICTIEKANSIINKLLNQGKLNELGIVVVDEIHLISDPGRGYILELLLAKILYVSRKFCYKIQIITMSATLTNIELLKKWLDAEIFITNFRPVELKEMIKIGNNIYDINMKLIRNIPMHNGDDAFPYLENDPEHVARLCIETLLEGFCVIVFCPSKAWCENLTLQLAKSINSICKLNNIWGEKLRIQIKNHATDEVKNRLANVPTGLDAILEQTITYACAFHHAGLTTEERDIIEYSFKSGSLKILVATSTLSSGVNLPARRVLIRSPIFGGKPISSLTYKQMIGRAGRMGQDTLGESILMCTENHARVGKELATAKLKPMFSCLGMDNSTHLKRALLEVISSGVCTTKNDIEFFVNCTLLHAQKCMDNAGKPTQNENIVQTYDALKFLTDFKFVRMQLKEENQMKYYFATRLGMACLASSMPPTDGLILFAELQNSRKCFVLESDLHAVYLVTPYSVCHQLQELDWFLFLELWEKLSPPMRKVGELVGVKESFLVRAMRNQSKLDNKQLQLHKRFYTALALQELVNETPMNKVAIKYKCSRGMIQSLQQLTSTFAGIVTAFCNSFQWFTLSLILSQFKERVFFGINQNLIDLMRLPILNHKMARILYNGGVKTLVELSNSDAFSIETLLCNTLSFDLAKQHENINAFEVEKFKSIKNIFINGGKVLSLKEASKIFINEAQKFIQYELGVKEINWCKNSKTCEKQQISQNLTEIVKFDEPKNNKNSIIINSNELLISYLENTKAQKDLKEECLKQNKNDDCIEILKKKEKFTSSNDIYDHQNCQLKDINSIDNNLESFSVFKNENIESNELSLVLEETNQHKEIASEIENKQPIHFKSFTQFPKTFTQNEIDLLKKENYNNKFNEVFAINLLKSFEIDNSLKLLSTDIENEIPSTQQCNLMHASILSTSRQNKTSVINPCHNHLLGNLLEKKPKREVKCVNSPTPIDNVSDTSIQNSFLKNQIQLNATHILNCSKEDTTASFQFIEIVDICGNQKLFEKAFKELESIKSFGFCIGLQQYQFKKKPLIGANILNNKNQKEDQLPLFHFDDFTYIDGVAFSISENIVYFMNMQDNGTSENLTSELKCKYLCSIFKSSNVKISIFEAKEQLKVLRKCIQGLDVISVDLEDPKVAHWLLQPDKTLTLQQMCLQFAPECFCLFDLCASERSYRSFGLNSSSNILAKIRCCVEACATSHILKGQIENLERIGDGQFKKFFTDVEMPLQILLSDMELNGFPVNQMSLQNLYQNINETMKKIEAKIYEMHGSRFNITSSSAVARILGLIEKSKNHRSTSKQVLEKINTPISKMILTYRKLNSILKKNIQPFLRKVENNRIHGKSVTCTCTGRIFMLEPNLQNVAKDFEVNLAGVEKLKISCRSVFFPSDNKRCLISADFCQLEMRILAHLSEDSSLIRIMKSEKDLFISLAAHWNKMPENEVTEEMRNKTKQICYGIIYGMGIRSLAQGLKYSEKEASLAMEQFHAAYPGIGTYIKKVVKFARVNGFVETITGRRRYLDNINSNDLQQKNHAERRAINSVIQGSAADVTKNAILRIENNISKYRKKLGFVDNNAVQFVLHLHDELIYEVIEEKSKKIAKIISVTMENCVKLNIPLRVKVKIGKSWGEQIGIKL